MVLEPDDIRKFLEMCVGSLRRNLDIQKYWSISEPLTAFLSMLCDVFTLFLHRPVKQVPYCNVWEYICSLPVGWTSAQIPEVGE